MAQPLAWEDWAETAQEAEAAAQKAHQEAAERKSKR